MNKPTENDLSQDKNETPSLLTESRVFNEASNATTTTTTTASKRESRIGINWRDRRGEGERERKNKTVDVFIYGLFVECETI